MDEMTMVRRLLAEPPPAPDVVAEGRERLFGSPDGAVPSTRRKRTAAVRRTVALSLTAAAAAAALIVAALVPGSGTTKGVGSRATDQGSARAVLLAAAVRAASTPTTTGTYWHVRTVTATTLPKRFGHGRDRYTLEETSITEQWTTHGGRSWLGRRVWVRPKTPADEAAWRRDGSPTTWCTGKTDTDPPVPICLHTAPGTASVVRFGPDTFQLTEGHKLTFGQLQRLPQDPHALRAWLVKMARRDLDPAASAAVVDLNVAGELSDLLVDFPVPPGVRAAAFRALAAMPGVTSIGPTRDELGRPGVGIEIGVSTPGAEGIAVLGDGSPIVAPAGRLIRTLIVDPQTSHVLSDRTSVGNSGPVIDTLVVRVGWTNGKPHKPAMR
jgi:hypothetical protein